MAGEGVVCLVLDSYAKDNRFYEDQTGHYVVPRQYHARISTLLVEDGPPVLAIVREPKGKKARSGVGRNAYVGFAFLSRNPTYEAATDEYHVAYENGLQPLDFPVPLVDSCGRAYEARLRSTTPNLYGSRLRGTAVRSIAFEDAQGILLAGRALLPDDYRNAVSVQNTTAREVITVQTLKRDVSFKKLVLPAYDYRCAVTGIGYTDYTRAPFGGLVEAAHVRPVGGGHQGGDEVTNGVSLSPTVHRLFDAGMLAFEYRNAGLALRISSRTQNLVLDGLGLVDGRPVSLPQDPKRWPAKAAVDYHRRQIWLP